MVVLAGIQDPGNLGTILRSAEAFGASGVVCLPGTVNAWNPKAVRSSAGSVFRVPVLNISEEEAVGELKRAGVRVLTTELEGAQAAHEADLAGAVALVIGNEGSGVATDLAMKVDGAVTIPCPGPVESLNAAVAASVLLYEAACQRTAARQRAATLQGLQRAIVRPKAMEGRDELVRRSSGFSGRDGQGGGPPDGRGSTGGANAAAHAGRVRGAGASAWARQAVAGADRARRAGRAKPGIDDLVGTAGRGQDDAGEDYR